MTQPDTNYGKALFIPLKTKYFNAFASGNKDVELRPYGPRWNERTCWPGRGVVLSKGYGKKDRLRGFINTAEVCNSTALNKEHRDALFALYGYRALSMEIIQIEIWDIERVVA